MFSPLGWTGHFYALCPFYKKLQDTWCHTHGVIIIFADVKFIANPPSMVAAGSVVAAVEGLQMRMVGNTMTSQSLTEQLAQIIRSDPVGELSH